MRRRTARRAYTKKRIGNRIKSQWSKISAGAGALAAVSNITSHDMAASTGQPIAARAQNFANSISGRIIGFTPFKNAAGANTPQTISLEGMFNKYTGIGLGLLGYAMIPARIGSQRLKYKNLALRPRSPDSCQAPRSNQLILQVLPIFYTCFSSLGL